jgi:plastin-1
VAFRVNNFSKDVSDGENYTILLNQLKPDDCSRAPLQTRDLRQRAEQVLQNAAKIGCRKYLTPASLVAGNPRLNLAFVANLFNTHPGLEPLDEQEAKDYGAVEDFDAEGEREARVFTLWLNSLGVDPAVFNFFENMRDGLVLLQAFDRVYPGVVVWRRVSKPKGGATSPTQPAFYVNENGEEEEIEVGVTPNQGTLSRFKQVENTNYCIELGKGNGMSLVGIQGSDIVDKNKTLVLGYVWQLMRCAHYRNLLHGFRPIEPLRRMSITKTLTSLSKTGQGRPVSDTEMLKWANTTAQKGKPGTKTIRSFKDPSITTGIFFLNVLEGIKPGIVDPSLVYIVDGQGDYEERRQNGTATLASMCNLKDRLTPARPAHSEIGYLNREKDERADIPCARGYR